MAQRFYWIKLGWNFLDDEVMRELERMGADCAYFYIKLLVRACEYEGRLTRVVGTKTFKHTYETLAELTRTPIATVKKSMDFLVDIGIVEETETEYRLIQMSELVGSESDSAARMRKLRASQSDKKVTERKSKRESKSKREAGGAQKSASALPYGQFRNVYLTNEQYNDLQLRYKDFEWRIENLSAYMNTKGITYGGKHYEKIIEWAVKDGAIDMRSVAEAKVNQARKEAELDAKWKAEHPLPSDEELNKIKRRYGIGGN